jgi:putative DNA methylase
MTVRPGRPEVGPYCLKGTLVRFEPSHGMTVRPGRPDVQGSTVIRKPETIAFCEGRLPHWEVVDGRYFITIHLAGAIPAQGRDRLRRLAAQFGSDHRHDSPKWIERQRMIFREMERWLDTAVQNAHLAEPQVAKMVVEAIEHRQRIGRWNVFEYVVMPTHLHLFCELKQPSLKEVIEDFKRWTGHQAARILRCIEDRFWQREWFDHWSRSDEEDERIARYIRQNPEKAGLVSDARDWPYGSCRSRLPDGNSGEI